MKMPDDEIVVMDIAGANARIKTQNSMKKSALRRIGFIEEDSWLVRPITDEDNRRRLVEKLIDLEALFSYGRDWCPAELLDDFRARSLINRPYRIISWSAPERYQISKVAIMHTPEPHKGIKASLPTASDVTHLFVDAHEADDFFYWSKTAAQKLKSLFPRLQKVIIEDDYLSQKQIDELPVYLAPISVEWTYGLYIDGRHGR